jgi:chondroitin 4-sulfotransferase 11
MKLIINNRKIIFIHIPKTAGTSILGTLLDNSTIYIRGHKKAQEYSDYEWKESFTFGVVRNPYDRFISHWLYHTSNYSGLKFSKRGIDVKNKSLKEYYDIAQIMSQWKYNWHTMTQFLTHPSGRPIDYILRYENIENDWAILCDLLQINKPLLKLKQTPHNHYNSYYDKETKNLVSSLYYEDFMNYSYELE